MLETFKKEKIVYKCFDDKCSLNTKKDVAPARYIEFRKDLNGWLGLQHDYEDNILFEISPGDEYDEYEEVKGVPKNHAILFLT